MLTRTTYRRSWSVQSTPPSIKETYLMSNRAMKFAALSAVAAVVLTGCSSKSSTPAAPATSAGGAATSAAAPATSAGGAATSAASASAPATSAGGSASASASAGGGQATGKVGVILPDSVTSKRWE